MTSTMLQAFTISFVISGSCLVILIALWAEIHSLRKITKALAEKNGLTLVE